MRRLKFTATPASTTIKTAEQCSFSTGLSLLLRKEQISLGPFWCLLSPDFLELQARQRFEWH
jgi:hypothetical protein